MNPLQILWSQLSGSQGQPTPTPVAPGATKSYNYQRQPVAARIARALAPSAAPSSQFVQPATWQGPYPPPRPASAGPSGSQLQSLEAMPDYGFHGSPTGQPPTAGNWGGGGWQSPQQVPGANSIYAPNNASGGQPPGGPMPGGAMPSYIRSPGTQGSLIG